MICMLQAFHELQFACVLTRADWSENFFLNLHSSLFDMFLSLLLVTNFIFLLQHSLSFLLTPDHVIKLLLLSWERYSAESGFSISLAISIHSCSPPISPQSFLQPLYFSFSSHFFQLSFFNFCIVLFLSSTTYHKRRWHLGFHQLGPLRLICGTVHHPIVSKQVWAQ